MKNIVNKGWKWGALLAGAAFMVAFLLVNLGVVKSQADVYVDTAKATAITFPSNTLRFKSSNGWTYFSFGNWKADGISIGMVASITSNWNDVAGNTNALVMYYFPVVDATEYYFTNMLALQYNNIPTTNTVSLNYAIADGTPTALWTNIFAQTNLDLRGTAWSGMWCQLQNRGSNNLGGIAVTVRQK